MPARGQSETPMGFRPKSAQSLQADILRQLLDARYGPLADFPQRRKFGIHSINSWARPRLISPIFDLNPLERARTKLKFAPGFLVRSTPKPRSVVDRVGAERPKCLF